MTDAMGGLSALVAIGGEPAEKALAAFHAQWRHEPLVLDKWFAAQARDPDEGAIGRILALTAHPDFDADNPNRLRALVQGFSSANPARFHDESGAGYRFLADQILAVDGFNPMTAARLVEPWAPGGAMRRTGRPDARAAGTHPRPCRPVEERAGAGLPGPGLRVPPPWRRACDDSLAQQLRLKGSAPVKTSVRR
jgi:hypothetical protein